MTRTDQSTSHIRNGRHRAGRLAVAGIAAAAITIMVAAPSRASTRQTLVASPRAPRPDFKPTRANQADSVLNSPEYAGYTASPSNGTASVSVTFTIPTIKCSAAPFNYLEPGVDTGTSYAYILEYCEGATPEYYYDASTPSGGIEEPAKPGDTVVTSIFESGSYHEADIHDVTNGQFWYDNYTGSIGNESANIGTFSSFSPIPSFSPVTITYSQAQVNGEFIGFLSPTEYKLTNGNDTLIACGSLSDSGSSFRMTFEKQS